MLAVILNGTKLIVCCACITCVICHFNMLFIRDRFESISSTEIVDPLASNPHFDPSSTCSDLTFLVVVVIP